MVITYFQGQFDNEPKSVEQDWRAFVDFLADHSRETKCAPCPGKKCPEKAAGWAFTPASYHEGTTRAAENVVDIHLFAGDLDHLTRDQVAEVRRTLDGLTHLLYSTHSHLRGGEDDNCLRVVLPLSRPVPAADYKRFWLAFAEISGLPLDRVVKSTASLLFLPNAPAGNARVFSGSEGEPRDVDAVMAHAAPAESIPALSLPPVSCEDFKVIDGGARRALIAAGKLARTLAPGGIYGPQKLGRRATCYNVGRLLAGHAAAGRFPLEEALEFFERLVEPPLTPGGACAKALRDGASVGGSAPLAEGIGHDLVAEALGLSKGPADRYTVEPWFWSQLETVCRGAPDTARPSEVRLDRAEPRYETITLPDGTTDEVEIDPDDDLIDDNPSRYRDKLTRDNVLRLLRRDDKERLKPCGYNASMLIRHLFYGEFRFNLLEKTVDAMRSRFRRETPDTLPKALADWLAGENDIATDFSSNQVTETLLLVGMENAFNPLREYLESRVWDGMGRIRAGKGGWLGTYANAHLTDDSGTDVAEYVREVGARWLVAAAARALHPGCKVDTVLVLEGKQGAGKSTLFKILGGDYYSETPLRIGDKDANIGAGSSWIIELAELASLKKAETEAQKQFLSTSVDTFRVPYGKASQRFPRSCVFGGTTNSDRYLVDRTGNRRYWCVKTGDVDKRALRRDRDQLWAEAVHLLRNASSLDLDRGTDHEQGSGERWWFERHEQEAADEITADRMGETVEDSYTEKIRVWLSGNMRDDALIKIGLTTTDVCERVLSMPAGQIAMTHLVTAGEALRKLGFVPKQVQRDGVRLRRYFKP